MKKLNYKNYFDKVFGCFLGKCIIGTLGAPFEGIKMPLELEFKPEMLDVMLPNDDLDLQVLWLDVCEKYGKDFTSYDLLECFCRCCDYNPGEYAIMRKNFERGIYPPVSGKFCNDFYINGMGSPIRSEVWACLSPLDPALAAEFATRDAVLDHEGDSVYAERFFAALESEAFFESDLERLIAAGLKQVPKRCKFRELVNDTLELCRRYDNVKLILRKVLKKYGHPDCTNLYENVAITLIALLKGDLDFIKTGMDALNCGFDTDCTCATAGAIVGLIRGAEDILSQYDFAGLKYVLSVRSNRRSDLVKDLAEDISFLGCEFNKGLIEGAPELSFEFSKRPTYPFDITVSYEDDLPLVSPERDCKITLHLLNKSDKTVECDFTLTGMGLKECFSLAVCPGEKADYSFTASVKGQSSFTNRNPLVLNFDYAGERKSFEFGIAASLPWKVIGPIWKTDPECTTEALVAADLQYRKITYAVPYDGNRRDISRRFHLNFAADTKTEYLTPDQCFEPMCCDETTPYEQGIFYPTDDNIRMDELFGFKGPCMCYLAQKLLIDHDKDICVQIGHSSPFELYINGELIARRDNCDNWYAENVHVEGVKLKKGENLVVLRLTRVNADAKYNLFFSEGVTCARHYPHLGAVDPTAF
ncbi:MAG: ADP-ribosylglycohydrolase family protein [Ruminococcaceae bacterium]|nr:ADP-ribosylglycohydrolase family protein [Oscillospiraceae bacterium]